ncbi:hypothetical protein [Pseudohongiella sp.]|uniref:Response regulatory domain-containing protein n=1 Tax=marine sediment metagenome TaxID=412755 RepID=A0A0F9W486_9ZZZZ|nr:hypothetical protein [Pseudohongiella sp.]HDZ07786.1 response regulator [Pseudohongiella sp.]HEA62897.1 response regulator [Pseudohongiella sp.]
MTTTVLVVDEDTRARQVLCDALQKHGFRTRQAADLAGVRQLRREDGAAWRPELSIVELVREHGNGFSVAAWLQSRGYGIVVLLSERNDVADRLWARSRGILHLASRAGGIDQLCARLQDIVADSQGASRREPA